MPIGSPKTAMQDRFIDEYLIDLNGRQAAIRAGYSEKTAQMQSSRLLSNAKVREEIDRRKQERSSRVGITQDRVLLELSRIAFFDPRRLLREDGSPKPMNELDDDTAAAIAGLDIQECYETIDDKKVFVGYVKKYRIADKNSALTNAMRHLQLFEDKIKIEVTETSKEALEAKFGEKMRKAREQMDKVRRERTGVRNDD
jgi:phage terminase small subunit